MPFSFRRKASTRPNPLRIELLEGRDVPAVLDPTFGAGGTIVAHAPADDFAFAVQVAADGHIYTAGITNNTATTGLDMLVECFHADGTLDTSFGVGGRANVDFYGQSDFAYGLALQPDGKLVLAGRADRILPDGQIDSDFAAARLNANGSLDLSFGVGGRQTVDTGSAADIANGLALQPDGKVVIVGFHQDSSIGYQFAVARLNTNGTPDATFGTGGLTILPVVGDSYDYAYAVTVQPDGKLVVAGFTQFWGRPGPDQNDFSLARLNANGTLDATFGTGGRQFIDIEGTYDYATSLALQPDGKIVVAGYSQQPGGSGNEFSVARLNPNGSPDATFDGDGKRAVSVFGSWDAAAFSVAVRPDGKVVLGGHADLDATGYDFAAVRLNGDGGLDGTFGTGGLATADFGSDQDLGYGMAVQADGNVVVTGWTNQSASGSGYDVAVARFLGNNGSATYAAQVLTDLTKPMNAGRTIPIRLQLFAAGHNVSAAAIDVTAVRLERVNADGSRTVVTLQDAGNSNPGNQFRYAGGSYIFNLSTKGLGAGTYDFVWMAEGDPTEHHLTFRLI